MKCKDYAPLVSRYLDEDLEDKDLETLLDHLSFCEWCNKEMEGVNRLRVWLQTADAQLGIPEMHGEWGLEDLLRMEASDEGVVAAESLPAAGEREASAGEGAGSGTLGWIRRNLFPSPFLPRYVMRFALPVLLIALGSAFYYTQHYAQQKRDWVDVTDLEKSPASTATFPQAESDEMDEIEYYVLQHATHQPWEQSGDEVPMMQLASTPSR